jgi:hypothetical protein
MHAAILEAVATPGDFDFDGQFDGDHLLRWQRGRPANPLSAADLDKWRANFASQSSLAVSAWVVAEPSAAILVLTGILAVLPGARLRSTRVRGVVNVGARRCAQRSAQLCANTHAIAG